MALIYAALKTCVTKRCDTYFRCQPPDIFRMGTADNIDRTGCHNGSLDYTVKVFIRVGKFLRTLSDLELAEKYQNMKKILMFFFCVGRGLHAESLMSILLLKGFWWMGTQGFIFAERLSFHQICRVDMYYS